MGLLRLFAFLPFPLFIFASPLSDRYVESLAHHFQECRFSESLRILDEWEVFEPEQGNKIMGMRAAVYLSVGDFEKSTMFMDQFIHSLSAEELSDPMMNFILQIYYKAFPGSSIEQVSFGEIARLETISEINFSRFFGSFEPIFDSKFGGNINFRI